MTKLEFQQVQLFIEEMKATSSTNDKKEILKKYDSPFLRKLFEYTYTPFKQYYVTSENLKKRKDLILKPAIGNHVSLFYLLDTLNERLVTGHSAIAAVNSFIEENKEFSEIIYDVIDRNLKTRATTTLINSVMPGTVPTFDVALAEKFDGNEKKVDFSSKKWWASRKLDGCLSNTWTIEFENGKKLTIAEVVDNKISGKIKSFNTETGEIEYCEILDWAKDLEDINENSKTEWYQLELENGIITPPLTGNHLIWLTLSNEWKRVDQLSIDDVILTI